MIVVTVARYAYIRERSDQTHAEVVHPARVSPATIKAVQQGEKRVQTLYREHVSRDPDGLPIGVLKEAAGLVTVVRAETIFVADITMEIARACGYKTALDLKERWAKRHPRSPQGVVIWYALGDWRDRDIFLNWSGRAGGDYTRNARRAMDADAPALSREEIDALSSVNRQKDDGRRARAAAALAAETPSERLKRLSRAVDRLGDEARRAIRQERRIIEQRLGRAEKRK